MKSINQTHIPYAVDLDGNAFLPQRGQNGMDLYCPDCHQAIEPRTQGTKVQPYYAHKREISTACCFGGGGESQEHRQACHLVKALVLRMMERSNPITLVLECELHSKDSLTLWTPRKGTVLIDKPIPGDLLPVMYRPDVAVVTETGEIDLWIEILHTHPVPSGKAEILNGHGIRWIELNLRNNYLEQFEWQAERHGGFKQMKCCIAADERAARLAQMVKAKEIKPSVVPDSPRLAQMKAMLHKTSQPVAIEPISEVQKHKPVDLDGLRWCNVIPDSWATHELVSHYSRVWPQWDWQSILNQALDSRSHNECIARAVRRIMANHRFSVSNAVVKNYLLNSKVLTKVISGGRELPIGFCPLNGLTPWHRNIDGARACERCTHMNSQRCCLTHGEAMTPHTTSKQPRS